MRGGGLPFQSVSCGGYSSNLTFSTDVFDFVMCLLLLNSSVVSQRPERVLHLPNYLQAKETICSRRKNKNDPEIENRLLYRHFEKSFTANSTVSSCSSLLSSAVVRNHARTCFPSHSCAHTSFVTSFLCVSFFHPTSGEKKKNCCLHPPSLSLSLSSKIILKSASTVQGRIRGAQRETHHHRHCCCRASKHAARLPTPTRWRRKALRHTLVFKAVMVAFLVHLGTLLEGEGLVVHFFFSFFFGGFMQTYTKRRVWIEKAARVDLEYLISRESRWRASCTEWTQQGFAFVLLKSSASLQKQSGIGVKYHMWCKNLLLPVSSLGERRVQPLFCLSWRKCVLNILLICITTHLTLII